MYIYIHTVYTKHTSAMPTRIKRYIPICAASRWTFLTASALYDSTWEIDPLESDGFSNGFWYPREKKITMV